MEAACPFSRDPHSERARTSHGNADGEPQADRSSTTQSGAGAPPQEGAPLVRGALDNVARGVRPPIQGSPGQTHHSRHVRTAGPDINGWPGSLGRTTPGVLVRILLGARSGF